MKRPIYDILCMIAVTPHTRCRLKLLKLERIKDYLLMEEEFIRNQERLKPQEEKHEVYICCFRQYNVNDVCVIKVFIQE